MIYGVVLFLSPPRASTAPVEQTVPEWRTDLHLQYFEFSTPWPVNNPPLGKPELELL
jgi:hypothetical protein